MRIIFTPVLAGKPWNGRTLTTEPLGGSESAVGFLARALAMRGHYCIVYTHHTEEGMYEGVEYRHGRRLNNLASERCDVHISARWPEILSAIPPAQVGMRILWVHDLGLRFLQGDKVVFLTHDHLKRQGVDDKEAMKRCYVIGNGVNLGDFVDAPPLEKRERGKMLWTSNPDRGLHVAARILQRLRKDWPELQLHVYGRAAVYGWGPEAEWPYYPGDDDWEGVVMHDPVPKARLAQELKEAWAWFYPTTWPETFCIAALEAQAAGTPCWAAPYAALNETVKGGILTYHFEETMAQLRDDAEWERLSKAGRQYAAQCSWPQRAIQWEQLINGGGDPVG